MKCNKCMVFMDVKFHWLLAQNGYKKRAFNVSIFSKLMLYNYCIVTHAAMYIHTKYTVLPHEKAIHEI